MDAKTLLPTACGLAAAFLPTLAQPVLTTEPADKAAFWGDRVTFTVGATGVEPLAYQWHFNKTPLAGRTNANLVLTNVTFADAGPYLVIASDSGGSVTSRVATLNVPAPAVLDPKLSANLRMGDDPAPLPTSQRAQAEPHIARSYSDPNLLVATFQEGRYADGGGAAVTCGYSVSANGGLTWTRALIPKLTSLDGGVYARASDPVAAIDLDGNLILSTIGLPANSAPTAVLWSSSSDRGATFGLPVRVDKSPPGWLVDKQWIAINTFPNSPTANRYHVMFDRILGDASDQLITVYSDDQGKTWSSPAPGPRLSFSPQQFFLPDGSLGVVYQRNDTSVSPTRYLFEFMHSLDGGKTFGAAALIGEFTAKDIYDDPVARDGYGLPSACTDRQAGVIYVAYQALTGPAPDRVPRILFTRSIDKGLTWSPPLAVSDTPDRRGVFNPCISVSPDGQHVTIAFYDKRHNTATTAGNLVDYYLAESFDGGETWEANLRLSEVSTDLRKAPLTPTGRMLADYQGIVPALNFDTPAVAVWIDTRTGNPDPYAVRIQRTKGTTFETWRKLRYATDDLADAAISGPDADRDGDGLPNLAEYAFGLEPDHANSSPFTVARQSNPDQLAVSFERQAGIEAFTSWEESTDLLQWRAFRPGPREDNGPSSDPTRQWVRAFFPLGSQAKFFRLVWKIQAESYN